MKKTSYITILIIFSLLICSCSESQENLAEAMKQTDFTASFSYAGYSEKVDDILASALNDTVVSSAYHFPVHIIESTKQLQDYKSNFFSNDILDKDWNELPSFNSATSTLDDDFFKSKVVYIIYIPTNSSSVRFTLKETVVSNDIISFKLEKVSLSEDVSTDTWGMFVTVTAPKKYSDAFNKADAVLVS